MEVHASNAAADRLASQRVAAEFRAEMARQKLTGNELAAALGVSAHTIGRRLNGEVPFNVVELAAGCRFLRVDVSEFLGRVKQSSEVLAS